MDSPTSAELREQFSSTLTLDQLPLELVRSVFSYLLPVHIAQVRLVCKAFSVVGWSFMIRHIHLIFKPDSFERLRVISETPALSPNITSLLYEADTLMGFDSYTAWESYYFDPEEMIDLPAHLMNDLRLAPGWERTVKQWAVMRQRRSKGLTVIYESYVNYVSIQDAMRKDKYDESLAEALARLPNLKHISLSLDVMGLPLTTKIKSAFGDDWFEPWGDPRRTEPLGVSQMRSLLLGSAHAGLKLETIQFGTVNWQILKQSSEIFSKMIKSVHNLKTLALLLSAGQQEPSALMNRQRANGTEILECTEYLKNGRLRNFVTAAPDLRKMTVRFDFNTPCPTELKYIVGDFKWQYLTDVTFGSIETTENDLVEFFSKHSTTLKNVALDSINLKEGSWRPTFQKLRRILHLEDARIGGELLAVTAGEWWKFGRGNPKMRDTVRRYLLAGGEGPLLDFDLIAFDDPYEYETDLEPLEPGARFYA